MFVDILGFKALTESNPIDLEYLKAPERLPSFTLESIDKFMAASRNQLSQTFSGFHYSLKMGLNLASTRHPLTAITFSDSAFIATTQFSDAANIGVDLMHSMLTQQIPIRMGIAYGSFAALRFSSEVSLDGGNHATEFLGTAVVRAHAAETCGIKGLRILLHPSVVSLLNDPSHNPVSPDGKSPAIRHLECSEKERANKAGVMNEVDYWHLPTTRGARAWHCLQDMWNKAPQSEVEHYEATAEAINRMRIAQGYEPLKKLRRRTLPS
ncbi:MAG: hypothetical protein HYX75_18435 [Acidobacteria bacterium]|nr:hypothetical protein [Acidobacteriota bacterium]